MSKESRAVVSRFMKSLNRELKGKAGAERLGELRCDGRVSIGN